LSSSHFLTPGQLQLLATEVVGPAPGWNAKIEIPVDGGIFVGGEEASDLFARALLQATPLPSPHEQEFDEDAGSLVLDHLWTATSAGRQARDNANASDSDGTSPVR
jgi:hypothetical protein